MAKCLSSQALRLSSSRATLCHPNEGFPFRPCRRLSTFKTSSGRVLAITNNTPTTTSYSDCDCDIQFPQGLEIDRSRPLVNTVASYNQHVVIATGKNDWESRIENEEGSGDMARALKDITKVQGDWFDPNYSTLISNSSFTLNSRSSGSSKNGALSRSNSTPPPRHPNRQAPTEPHRTSTSLFLFPHFLYFRHLTNSPSHLAHLASTYLNDQALQPQTRPEPPPPDFKRPQPITKPTILICSHGGRDARCGILGPLLYREFGKYSNPGPDYIHIGMISHIGGHAFAGNVIVYIPPGFTLPSASGGKAKEGRSPLEGMGIWYGRVEPRHVEGIVRETVREGKIIGELWRGGLDVGRQGKWRDRTVGARTLRIPSDVLQGDGRVVEEIDGGGQETDTGRRVKMMGPRARERWERER
ncbi:MAG: hypothetical protein LQ338_007189 [Usnochroma carphineum]|nr:MAG: hypothetical protein LQ338_007189 [Usnochroma carphineum]